ncbi:uncharacterized protein LOC141691736 [Apium graveolens]|uniref:uncharacterized protein LOC141691736 n=1 Tax=Apium graveolens TaxID=4045 RepID=UPI003D7BE6EC
MEEAEGRKRIRSEGHETCNLISIEELPENYFEHMGIHVEPRPGALLMEASQPIMLIQEGIVEEASDEEESPEQITATLRRGKWAHKETTITMDPPDRITRTVTATSERLINPTQAHQTELKDAEGLAITEMEKTSEARADLDPRMPSMVERAGPAEDTIPILVDSNDPSKRLVNKMFKHQLGKTMEAYVVDMLVKSKEARDHVRHLAEMFQILREYRMKLNPQKCVFGVESGKFLGFIVNHRGIEANSAKIQALLEMRSPRRVKDVQSLTGRVAALNRFVSKSSDKCQEFFKAIKGVGRNFKWTEECEEAFQNIKKHLRSPPMLSNPKAGETLILYLAVSDFAISAVLVREEDGVQLPINGGYQAKGPRTELYLKCAQRIIARFNEVRLELIPCGQNEGADELAKLGSRRESTLLGTVPLDIQRQPSVPEHEVGSLNNELGPTWMTSILAYIREGSLPDEKNEARRIKYKAARYVIYDEILYRRGFSVPLLKYIHGEECNYILREVHEGICGNHSGEAEPLATITARKLREFVYRAIVCRYGIPYKLISDNGKQFDSKEMREFCEQLGIQKSFSAVCHPQKKKGAWPEELAQVLWSYNTTPRTTTGETPFSLVYGCEAMVPVEVGAGSFRRDNYDSEANEVNHRLYLDMIEETREEAQIRIAAYQQRTARHYNNKVRARTFKVGDLVLRRLMPNTKVTRDASSYPGPQNHKCDPGGPALHQTYSKSHDARRRHMRAPSASTPTTPASRCGLVPLGILFQWLFD